MFDVFCFLREKDEEKEKEKEKKEQPFRPTHIHCTPGLAELRPAIRHLAQVCGGYVRSVNY